MVLSCKDMQKARIGLLTMQSTINNQSNVVVNLILNEKYPTSMTLQVAERLRHTRRPHDSDVIQRDESKSKGDTVPENSIAYTTGVFDLWAF